MDSKLLSTASKELQRIHLTVKEKQPLLLKVRSSVMVLGRQKRHTEYCADGSGFQAQSGGEKKKPAMCSDWSYRE